MIPEQLLPLAALGHPAPVHIAVCVIAPAAIVGTTLLQRMGVRGIGGQRCTLIVG